MSSPKIPEPALLVVSILTAAKSVPAEVAPPLTGALGPLQEEIGPLSFDFTHYYDAEMGPGIKRWLWVFADLVDPGELARIKVLTNDIEQAYSLDGKRRFNLDPGLLTLGNFVLATGKNNAHRIYLGKGIFADLTLVFRRGSYQPLEWTYPDYADAELVGVLNRLREGYKWKTA